VYLSRLSRRWYWWRRWSLDNSINNTSQHKLTKHVGGQIGVTPVDSRSLAGHVTNNLGKPNWEPPFSTGYARKQTGLRLLWTVVRADMAETDRGDFFLGIIQHCGCHQWRRLDGFQTTYPWMVYWFRVQGFCWARDVSLVIKKTRAEKAYQSSRLKDQLIENRVLIIYSSQYAGNSNGTQQASILADPIAAGDLFALKNIPCRRGQIDLLISLPLNLFYGIRYVFVLQQIRNRQSLDGSPKLTLPFEIDLELHWFTSKSQWVICGWHVGNDVQKQG